MYQQTSEKISLAAGTFYGLLAIYYTHLLYQGTKSSSGGNIIILLQSLVSILPYIITPSILNFWLWSYLKNASKKGVKVKYGLIISLIFSIGPILLFIFISIIVSLVGLDLQNNHLVY